MVLSTGQVARPSDVGYYVGLVEASFSLVQMMCVFGWGRLADDPRVGRKPVLVVSLAGALMATVAFGFAKRLEQMYAARCLAGLFGGGAVVIRALFADVARQGGGGESDEALAFAWFGLATALGGLVGPVVGGILAERWPNSPYPFAPPCLVVAAYVAIALVLVLVFLREPPQEASPMTTGKAVETTSLRSLVGNRRVLRALATWLGTTTLTFGTEALLPTYLFTPRSSGGLQFTPRQIAAVNVGLAIASATWLLGVLPRLVRRLPSGARGVYRLCIRIWPAVFLLPIIAPYVHPQLSSLLVLAAWVLASSFANLAFTACQLVLNASAPSSSALGTLNAVAVTMTGASKAVCPAGLNALLAWGVGKYQFAGLAWAVLAVVAAGQAALTWM